MSYRKYIASTIGVFLGCSVLYTLLILGQLGAQTPVSKIIDRIYTVKSGLEANLPSPKITVVSGSNAWYGISCALIQKELDQTCFNGAANANVGVDYMLYRAQQWLEPGDTVLLALEYHNYEYSNAPSDRYIDYILAHDPQYLNSVDWTTKMRFLWGISSERLKEGLALKLSPPVQATQMTEGKTFSVSSLGDRTDNLEANITPEMQEEIDAATSFPIKNWQFSPEAQEHLKAFFAWCRANKVEILATWPNTIEFEAYQSPKAQAFFETIQAFYQAENVPVLGNPESFMYGKELFFDSVYHLHQDGTQQRTEQLTAMMQPYLNTAKPKQADKAQANASL